MFLLALAMLITLLPWFSFAFNTFFFHICFFCTMNTNDRHMIYRHCARAETEMKEKTENDGLLAISDCVETNSQVLGLADLASSAGASSDRLPLQPQSIFPAPILHLSGCGA
jgi:hypothetical protein